MSKTARRPFLSNDRAAKNSDFFLVALCLWTCFTRHVAVAEHADRRGQETDSIYRLVAWLALPFGSDSMSLFRKAVRLSFS